MALVAHLDADAAAPFTLGEAARVAVVPVLLGERIAGGSIRAQLARELPLAPLRRRLVGGGIDLHPVAETLLDVGAHRLVLLVVRFHAVVVAALAVFRLHHGVIDRVVHRIVHCELHLHHRTAALAAADARGRLRRRREAGRLAAAAPPAPGGGGGVGAAARAGGVGQGHNQQPDRLRRRRRRRLRLRRRARRRRPPPGRGRAARAARGGGGGGGLACWFRIIARRSSESVTSSGRRPCATARRRTRPKSAAAAGDHAANAGRTIALSSRHNLAPSSACSDAWRTPAVGASTSSVRVAHSSDHTASLLRPRRRRRRRRPTTRRRRRRRRARGRRGVGGGILEEALVEKLVERRFVQRQELAGEPLAEGDDGGREGGAVSVVERRRLDAPGEREQSPEQLQQLDRKALVHRGTQRARE